ncbi:MAG: TetR/AcrR family transcriptional regulator [Anaerolineales bacterium]|nr:TetR/AcrR family transcriptional regulator [Anaerolineales bacterium]
MGNSREQFIETTCELIEAQGFHATGLNQIIKESGAPKGSLYYHFPEGKEELVEEAIERTGRSVSERITVNLDLTPDPAKAVRDFVRRIADNVETSGYRSGGPLMTVAMETATTSERINLACRNAYRGLQMAFDRKLHTSGFSEERSAELAQFIVAAIEGGIILSRTNHTGDPLRSVAAELQRVIQNELA